MEVLAQTVVIITEVLQGQEQRYAHCNIWIYKMREKKLRKIIREELTRKIEVKKSGRPGEDEPMEGEVFEKVEVNVLDWFVSYLPYMEQALRIMENTVQQNNNKIFKELAPALESLSKILIENEGNLKAIAEFASKVKPIIEIKHEGNTQKRLDNKIVN